MPFLLGCAGRLNTFKVVEVVVVVVVVVMVVMVGIGVNSSICPFNCTFCARAEVISINRGRSRRGRRRN